MRFIFCLICSLFSLTAVKKPQIPIKVIEEVKEKIEKDKPTEKKEKLSLPVYKLSEEALKIRTEARDSFKAILSKKKKARVAVIPLRSAVDESLHYFLSRAFEKAKEEKIDAIIIDMDTPGGRIDITEKIVDLYEGFDGPVYTFINHRAQSAGAMLSFGSDMIFMSPSARIGSAMPILVTGGSVQETKGDYHEKILSDTRTLGRSLAQRKGYPEDLIAAMIDNDLIVKRGETTISAKDQLLNLSAKEAIKRYDGEPLLAYAMVKSPEELLEQMGATDNSLYSIEVFEKNHSERLAEVIQSWAPLLMMIAMALFYLEFNIPGFGAPGILGIACIILVYFGFHVAGLASPWEVLIIFIGALLLAFEIFVIPGFGIAGISGLICIFGGLIFMMLPELSNIPELPDKSFNWGFLSPFLDQAFKNLFISLFGGIILVLILMRTLRNTRFLKKLILDNSDELVPAEGMLEEAGLEIRDHFKELLGRDSEARTKLRPSGKIRVDGQDYDVITQGEMIDKGEKVRIIAVEGNTITVEQVTNE